MTRRTALVAVTTILVLLVAVAALYFGSQPKMMARSGMLTIYSSTDTDVFQPIIDDFRTIYPGIVISYEEMSANELNRRFLAEAAAGSPRADLLLSSAMDLQTKLVNDGFAMPHVSHSGLTIPDWARWRDEAFGFTFEPSVLVFNNELMGHRPLPRSRSELMDAIKSDPEFWRGRIGVYDISRSSVGYLLATQEARQSSQFGALTGVLGSMHPRKVENTSAILDALKRGELVLGYGVLGSYAQSEVAAGAPLTIIFPQDFTLAVSRTAVIPKNARNAGPAHMFLDYLLSKRGQTVLATRSRLDSVRGDVLKRSSISEEGGLQQGIVRPIALGPGLLVYLDQQKRARMLQSWQTLISAPAADLPIDR